MTSNPRGPAEESALGINIRANNYVRTVSDDSPENRQHVRDRAELFGYIPGVHQEYVRDFLRPANRGQGRQRDR